MIAKATDSIMEVGTERTRAVDQMRISKLIMISEFIRKQRMGNSANKCFHCVDDLTAHA